MSGEALFKDMNGLLSSIKTANLPPVQSFVGAWGNNDVVPDYFFNVSEKEHPYLQERIKILNRSLYSIEEANSMVKCAFFSRRRDDVVFINLHSLVWSYTLKPPLADDVEDPCGQFTFLERELEFAKVNYRKVMIMSHIPPIVDVFKVIRNGKFTNISKDMLWKESYYRRYVNLLSKYKDVISAQFFGHLHFFYFLSFNDFVSPAFVLPGVTPLYGNAPSYLLGFFTDDWELINLKQRTLFNSTWNDTIDIRNDFAFGYKFSNKILMRNLIKDLYKDTSLWIKYLQLHNGGTPRDEVFSGMKTTPFSRAVVVCSMLTGIYEEIKMCVDELVGTDDSMGNFNKLLGALTIVILPLVSIIIFVIVICLFVFIVPKPQLEASSRNSIP